MGRALIPNLSMVGPHTYNPHVMSDLSISPPLTNAAGPHSVTREELIDIAQSASGAIVTKSMTHCPREGNPEPRWAPYVADGHGSINSMGLNNLGYRGYAEIIPELAAYGKPVIASLSYAPCEHELPIPEQYLLMARAMAEAGADALEVNLSTPNLTGIPIANDPDQIQSVLGPLMDEVALPIAVKLPPYNNDLPLFDEVAGLLVELNVDAIATMNSEPNTMDIDLETRRKVIRPREGYGGLGGPAILPIALAEVHRFYRYFQSQDADIAIWGCGGVDGAEDAIKHFLAGASVVQIATALAWEGPNVFRMIWDGIEDWLAIHGHGTVGEIIGTVRDADTKS